MPTEVKFEKKNETETLERFRKANAQAVIKRNIPNDYIMNEMEFQNMNITTFVGVPKEVSCSQPLYKIVQIYYLYIISLASRTNSKRVSVI